MLCWHILDFKLQVGRHPIQQLILLRAVCPCRTSDRHSGKFKNHFVCLVPFVDFLFSCCTVLYSAIYFICLGPFVDFSFQLLYITFLIGNSFLFVCGHLLIFLFSDCISLSVLQFILFLFRANHKPTNGSSDNQSANTEYVPMRGAVGVGAVGAQQLPDANDNVDANANANDDFDDENVWHIDTSESAAKERRNEEVSEGARSYGWRFLDGVGQKNWQNVPPNCSVLCTKSQLRVLSYNFKSIYLGFPNIQCFEIQKVRVGVMSSPERVCSGVHSLLQTDLFATTN